MLKKITKLLVLIVMLLVLTLSGCSYGEIDKNDIAKFIIDNTNIEENSVKDFAERNHISYIDVDEDGIDEVFFVEDSWNKNIFGVKISEDKEMEIILQDECSKYKNEIAFQDGFLKITKKTGGTGIQDTWMDLWRFKDGRMVKVLEGLQTEYSLSVVGENPVYHSGKAEISGQLSDFEYINRLIIDDNGTETETIDQYILYVWNEEKFKFDGRSFIYDPKNMTIGNKNFNSEIIGNETYDIKNYELFVINDYNGRNNENLKKVNISNSYYTESSYDESLYREFKFAVFGKIKKVSLSSTNWGEELYSYYLDEDISNSVVTLKTMLPGDGSMDTIKFSDYNGNNYTINYFDDLSDGEIIKSPIIAEVEKNEIKLTSDRIKWLQESLKIAGVYTNIDGGFGPNTKSNLNQFKKSVGLDGNGYFDKATERELEKIRDKTLARFFGTNKVLVNKNYFLPREYEPEKQVANVNSYKDIFVASEVKEPLENMFKDAKNEGHSLVLLSGYRTYDYQAQLFNNRVSIYGFEDAEKAVALPGESEHQTGLAVDLSSQEYSNALGDKFENTESFQWLLANCYKYGFILRYLKDKTDITGYKYEPWHYRYIGDIDAAKYIMDNGLTYEEYIEEKNL